MQCLSRLYVSRFPVLCSRVHSRCYPVFRFEGQTYVLFYQLWKVGQTGHVTRIVSGCANEKEEEAMRSSFDKQIRYGIPTGKNRFHLHFTPDYSKEVRCVYCNPLNKPYGVLHWMEHVLKMPETLSQYSDTMFIIIDPDQIIVRPFKTRDFTEEFHPSRWRTYDSNTHAKFNVTPRVLKEGAPFSQFFPGGSNWIHGVNSDLQRVVDMAWKSMDNNPAFTNAMRTSSHLYNWTELDMSDYYSAGAPYIAMGPDMYRIAKVWSAVSLPVYELTSNPISEMYAYSTAAAQLSLPHHLGYNFMISDAAATWVEGWNQIDAMSPNDVCQHTWSDWRDPENVEYRQQLPYLIHYRQEYFHGPYYFCKYLFSKDFLTCDHALLADPSDHDQNISDPQQSFALSYHKTSSDSDIPAEYRKRHAFMLCHLIPRINEAAIFWKNSHCEVGTANYDKEYIGLMSY
jgi:peptidyl serine alpha-galactosyltransferase